MPLRWSTDHLKTSRVPIARLLVERVDGREAALEVPIRAEGLASLVGELRRQGQRMAA